MFAVSSEFADLRLRVSGEAGRRWLAGLPALVSWTCARWRLTLDPVPGRHGGTALVLMAHSGDEPCVLKVYWRKEITAGEATGLRAWSGVGVVRLRAHYPNQGVLLDAEPKERDLVTGSPARKGGFQGTSGARYSAGVFETVPDTLSVKATDTAGNTVTQSLRRYPMVWTCNGQGDFDNAASYQRTPPGA